jgi:large subunit ribosomal protein L18e
MKNMKTRNKNPETRALIDELKQAGLKVPAWKAVAKGLNRPNRKKHEVDLLRLEKHAKKGENVVVPGTVLGTGRLSKPLEIAALRFSGKAREKVEKAGGKCMSISDALKQNPDAKKVRIMG